MEKGLSITKDVVNISSTVSSKAHSWAKAGADFGFGWGNYFLESTKATLEAAEMGGGKASKALDYLQIANSAAYSFSKQGIALSEIVASKSYSAADAALASAGAKDGVLVQMVARKLLQTEEASEAAIALIDFTYEFLRECDIPLQSLPRALMIIARLHLMCSVVPDESNCTRNASTDVELREALKHYHKYSLGALGSSTLKFLNIVSPLAKFESEDVCTAEMTGLEKEDILYRSSEVSMYMPSLYIARDPVRQEICLVFNGTANHHDLLVDLTCKSVRWETTAGESLFVHEGFARTVDKLEPALFSVVEDILSQPRHEGYQLVIVGYSLGAAAASMFTLKWIDRFPDVRTYAFAPPACVAAAHIDTLRSTNTTNKNNNASATATATATVTKGSKDVLHWFRLANSRITGVVLGRDLVPRLSQSTAEDLRDCLTYLLANAEVIEDIEGAFQRYDTLVSADREDEEDEEAEADIAVQLRGLHSEFRAIHKEMVDTHCFRPKMHPIGNIFYLNTALDDVSSKAAATAISLHAREDHILLETPAHLYSQIIISRDMLSSHLSNAYQSALDKL